LLSLIASFCYFFSASSLFFASRHNNAGRKEKKNVTDRLQTQT
jgi:hypothetical protein